MSRRARRRRVAIVTGTRAEFGLLEPVLRAMLRHPRLEPYLIVTGMHLLPKFGHTIDHIRSAGYSIAATVRMQSGCDSSADEPLAVSRGIAGIARTLARLKSEVVLVLGDRIEAFAGAAAGSVGRRVVAHIHGGDRATGDVDDSLRNAITRLAHVHFAASRDAASRLRRMGEPPGRIHVVGAPGLDTIRAFMDSERRSPRESDVRLAAMLGPLSERPYAVIIQHPCGRTAAVEAAAMRAIIAAVERCGLGGVIIHPSSDPGHDGILQVIGRRAGRSGWLSFPSLPREDYLRVVSRSAVLVGNSSGGIIESASLGVNAVNVGSRQAGRLRCGRGVIDARESETAVLSALRRALGRPRPRPGRSVYGDGRAGERICRVLAAFPITQALLQKALVY